MSIVLHSAQGKADPENGLRSTHANGSTRGQRQAEGSLEEARGAAGTAGSAGAAGAGGADDPVAEAVVLGMGLWGSRAARVSRYTRNQTATAAHPIATSCAWVRPKATIASWRK